MTSLPMENPVELLTEADVTGSSFGCFGVLDRLMLSGVSLTAASSGSFFEVEDGVASSPGGLCCCRCSLGETGHFASSPLEPPTTSAS